MAVTPIIGGPRDGTDYQCACAGDCDCDVFGCGARDGNQIMDGYVLWQMYRKVGGAFRPSHIMKQTMILEDVCPRCDRPMPPKTNNCKNCGACMGVSFDG